MGLMIMNGVEYFGGMDADIASGGYITTLDNTMRTTLNTEFELADDITNYDVIVIIGGYQGDDKPPVSSFTIPVRAIDYTRDIWIAGGNVDRSIKMNFTDSKHYLVEYFRQSGADCILGVYGIKLGFLGKTDSNTKIDLLWDSESYTTGATPDVTYDLAHSLSDYDLGYIVYAYPGDRTSGNTLHVSTYAPFIVSDLFSGTEDQQHILIAGYGTRFRSIFFTNSTFKVENIGNEYSIYKIYGVRIGGITQPKHTYSTSEKIVGTWVDGKPIYEKTLAQRTYTSVQDWTVLDANDTTPYDLILDARGYVIVANKVMPQANVQASECLPRLSVGVVDHKLYYYTNENRNAAITMQYTKTTD